jgi:hypothetical protein
VGLISNGLYDINGVQSLLDLVTKWIGTLQAKKAVKNQPQPKEA